MKMLLQISLILLSLVLLASLSFGDDFDDAVVAYQSGDFKKAHQLMLTVAEQGDIAAQYNIGLMYENGQGVPQDYKEAVKWYRLSAEQGHAQAQNILGFMYEKGQGVPQDYKEAVKWYRLSAEQGRASAQYNFGLMYLDGHGVLQSFENAYAWWVVAAANGHEDARGNMKVAQNGKMTPTQIERGQQIAKEIWARIGN